MDTSIESPVPQVRSDAQAQASRLNGCKSLGPVSIEGKATASVNAIRHGIIASSTLLPTERAEDYRAALDDWSDTLRPSSPGEARLVARIGDLDFRLRRVQEMEDRHQAAMLEAKLKESPAAAALHAARSARLGLAALIDTVTGVSTCTGDRLSQLLAPVRKVLEWLGGFELSATVTVPMEETYKELVTQAALDLVDAEVFQRLISAAANLVEALDTKVTDLEREVEAEREKIASEVLLGDDKHLKKLGRYRSILSKQLDAELGRLKTVRELAQATVSGSFCTGISVELKVIGRR
jgi:hypothetical protein